MSIIFQILFNNCPFTFLSQVVRISRAKVMEIKQQYRRFDEGLVPIELSILPHSKVEILEHVPRNEEIAPQVTYQPIALENAGSMVGEHVCEYYKNIISNQSNSLLIFSFIIVLHFDLIPYS